MKRILLVYCLFYCLAHALWVSASTKLSIKAPNQKWYIKGSVGATFPRIDNTTSISAGPSWPNDAYAYHHVNPEALLSILGGYTWHQQTTWLPFYSLGVSYTYAFPNNISGKVLQYSLPEFTNYNFQYKIQRQTLLAIAKADLYRWCNIMPFLSLGAGLSWNNAYDYEESATPNVTPRVSPGFKGRTSTHFSYVLGAGFDYIVKNNFWLSVEYNYGYYGNAQTGTGVNTSMLTGSNYSNSSLNTKLTENTIVFSANYFFDCIA